jgi:DNA-binding Xre family transcriptional regulator
MVEREYNLKDLSKKSNINILKMAYLLFVPFSKIKLTQALNIAKALKIKVSDLC